MAGVWTIRRCMDWTRDYLRDKGEGRPRLAAEWMLSSVTGLSRMDLYLDINKPLSQRELDVMHSYVVRRVKGEPLQYITGDTQFRTLVIACEPGVLIPRPETEVLVEEVLSFLDAEVLGARGPRCRAELPWNAEVEAVAQAELAALAATDGETAGVDGDRAGWTDARAQIGAQAGPGASAAGDGGMNGAAGGSDGRAEGADAVEGTLGLQAGQASEGGAQAGQASEDAETVARVLEIGSGTGCISLSLASERPGRVACVATDIDPHAVALSLRNREALGIDPAFADFREGDLTAPIALEERGTFDVLVSNPPYIPTGVMAALPAEVVRYEPRRALESGADGLDMFRRILAAAPHMLRPGGLLACELHEDSLEAAKSLCLAAGFADARIVPDLAGRPRIILARLD